jgi:phenylacetate-CoA ligase
MLATPDLINEAAQPHRLAEALPGYLQGTPMYQELPPLSERGFSHLPMITKSDIRRDFPHNFLGENADLDALVENNEIELEHTSGTSEERTPLLLPLGWWAEQELRALKLNPFVAEVLAKNPEARRVTINSPVCSGEIKYTGVPSRDDRILGNSLFASLSRFPFLWSDADLSRIASELLEWQPQFLDVDPVYATVFALYCERQGISFPSLKFILCSYEFVSVVHRRILERVFRVPVLNLYGSTETGHLMMEQENGLMRPVFETAFFENVNTDAKGVSDLVVTTLTNPLMPLVRYWIGDLVERLEKPYSTRFIVHGRVADSFRVSGGKRVTTWEIDQAFKDVEGIAHYQLVERRDGPWLLRFVPEKNGAPNPPQLEKIQSALTDLLELKQPVTIQSTDMIAPESSGKFRLGYPSAK